MALITIEGPMGSGKTGLASWFAYQDYLKGRRIFCNYHVNFPYTPFDQELFFKLNEEEFQLDNCHIVADEGYLYMDARTSMSGGNRVVNYYSMQTRKRAVDMSITTHSFDRLDKRIRQAVTVRIACRYIPETYLGAKKVRTAKGYVWQYCRYNSQDPEIQLVRDKKGQPAILTEAKYKFRIRRLDTGAKPVTRTLPASEVRPLYDTLEVVNIPKRLLGATAGNQD